ncbi:MAG: hypothetical protein Q8N54_05810 [Sulfurimicrobium sp.]|nr:hypothetical protein [Sulfurimicrobium sp.]MDZ7657356.1 hypothetical protein [Sulfurimicrobium sp.]
MDKGTIGKRLREERERLGLNQASFGMIGGVKKLAQLNYEKDDRIPSSTYFDNLRENKNIDVDYILSGLRDNNEGRRLRAESRVNLNIAMALELWPSAFSSAVDDAYQQNIDNSNGNGFPVEAYLADEMDDKYLTVENSIYKTIESSPRIIDFKMLEDVITRLESAVLASAKDIQPAKKAQAIITLYRAFKASGKVDQRMIEEVVTLASG